jgi:midasin
MYSILSYTIICIKPNPCPDVGKKELPAGLRGRFTDLYVEELTDPADLRCVVQGYLRGINNPSLVGDIVAVYLGCRAASEDHLTDSAGQRPRYSLRSLTRSLQVKWI